VTGAPTNSPQPVSVIGMGAVTPLGRNLDGIARLLEQSPSTPAGFRRVIDDLSDPLINREMRRADRFAKMAAMAAIDAWNSMSPQARQVPGERVAIMLTSGFGPHGRGFRFLDGILDNGDKAASPTDFSHSVHGAASAYISRLLGLRGPSLAVTDFEFGFDQAVLLAQCWLSEGACDRVLIGAVEELGEVMLHCSSRMVPESMNFWPGEGAVFLTLARNDVAGSAFLDAVAMPTSIDLLIVEDPPAPWLTKLPQKILDAPTVTFSSHFGHSASSSAFDVLGGLLAMRAAKSLGRSISGCSQTPSQIQTIDKVLTFRTLSDARAATLLMTTTCTGS
jgi:hypothetical protein